MDAKIDNILLIGTSHVAEESIKKVREAVKEHEPGFIALELDRGRLGAMLSKKQAGRLEMLKAVGVTGFIFAVIGQWVQQTIGKIVKIDPGEDMLSAFKIAKKHKIPVVLIDQEIQLTLRRFGAKITWKERFRFIGDLIFGFLPGKKKMKIDLREIPSEDVIINVIGLLKERYPNVYKTLIAERNMVMSHRLIALSAVHPDKKILAVVGAGHVPGMKKILESAPKVVVQKA